MQASFDSCTVSISSLYITHSPSLSSSPPSPAPLQHLVHQPRHAASCVAVGGAEMAVDLLALAHSSNERTAVPLQVRGATALQVRGATALQVRGATALQVRGATALQVRGATSLQVRGATAGEWCCWATAPCHWG